MPNNVPCTVLFSIDLGESNAKTQLSANKYQSQAFLTLKQGVYPWTWNDTSSTQDYQLSLLNQLFCYGDLLLLCKLKCNVISNQHKRCPVADFLKAITSHPFHGLVKRFTGALPTNKMLIETTHQLLCCYVTYGPQSHQNRPCTGS